MRLAELLSKDINNDFLQVEGFLDNKRLKKGKQKKIAIGRIALNFYCRECDNIRTFISDEELFCVGINDNQISIDCVLSCPSCNTLVPMWFLLESEDVIYDVAPKVRVIKKDRKLSPEILISNEYDKFSEFIDKAELAHKNGFGAGSIVYLRIVLEQIVKNAANEIGIKAKNFKDRLTQVDAKCRIVPREFSENGYRLFSDLSECIHGNCAESAAYNKYIPLKRLVTGIIDNIRNNNEITNALSILNWDGGNNAE